MFAFPIVCGRAGVSFTPPAISFFAFFPATGADWASFSFLSDAWPPLLLTLIFFCLCLKWKSVPFPFPLSSPGFSFFTVCPFDLSFPPFSLHDFPLVEVFKLAQIFPFFLRTLPMSSSV